jgi:prepilin-type N-terminal cleavage/methylation domain-containing protein
MNAIQKKRTAGLTLIEVMVSVVIIVVGVLGAAGYRYYCALDARKADIQITTARVGSMLLETWKATGGSSDFDPLTEFASELAITTNSVSLNELSGYNSLPCYSINIDGSMYIAMLSYQDDATSGLRLLNVRVAQILQSDEQQYETVIAPKQVISLTTYTVN